jgi:hypothetical protein
VVAQRRGKLRMLRRAKMRWRIHQECEVVWRGSGQRTLDQRSQPARGRSGVIVRRRLGGFVSVFGLKETEHEGRPTHAGPSQPIALPLDCTHESANCRPSRGLIGRLQVGAGASSKHAIGSRATSMPSLPREVVNWDPRRSLLDSMAFLHAKRCESEPSRAKRRELCQR